MQDIRNAHSDKQREDMYDLEKAGACLFCPEGLALKGKRVFHSGEHWYITPNDFPYKGTMIHVMIVPKRHVTSFTELTNQEILELSEMISWANKEFNIKGAGMFCRYGDTSYTGATIHHFHIHIVQGGERTENTPPIFALIGYESPTQKI